MQGFVIPGKDLFKQNRNQAGCGGTGLQSHPALRKLMQKDQKSKENLVYTQRPCFNINNNNK